MSWEAVGCLVPTLVLTLALACPAQYPSWSQVTPASSPPGRISHAMAYDSARQRTVLFGGLTDSGLRADTWEWDGKAWTEIKPKTSPPARGYHAMVYDSGRQRSVLFGGNAGSANLLADTWEWDGTNWTQVKPAASPSARDQHTMGYDSSRQRTVLFGGYDGGAAGDTWEWDGRNWTQIKPAVAPPGRVGPAMAYDSLRQRTVLFGGYAGGYLGDTWEWDGKNWAQVQPSASPGPRCYHAMVYDASRRRTLLFGGDDLLACQLMCPSFGFLGDTWEYDGKDWTLVSPITSPPGRAAPAAAYDATARRTLLFGGVAWGSSSRFQDTWQYGGTQLILTADTSMVSLAQGGTQKLNLDAGPQRGGLLYWVFGSVTGTTPGITLPSAAGPVNIPLNPDFWTDVTIALPNSAVLTQTRAVLDTAGKGQALLNVPPGADPRAIGVSLHHAYLVFDASYHFQQVSNPVRLSLVK